MKTMKIIASVMTLMALVLVGCTSSQKPVTGKCHITGSANSRFDGKKIFLVPITRPATMETVDSVVISNGKFEFTADDVCPVCGTKLSDEYKANIRNKAVDEFNINKSKRLEAIMKEATSLKEEIAAITGANNEYKEIIKPGKEKAIEQPQ